MLIATKPKIKFNFGISSYNYSRDEYNNLEFALNLVNKGDRVVTNIQYLKRPPVLRQLKG